MKYLITSGDEEWSIWQGEDALGAIHQLAGEKRNDLRLSPDLFQEAARGMSSLKGIVTLFNALCKFDDDYIVEIYALGEQLYPVIEKLQNTRVERIYDGPDEGTVTEEIHG